MDVSSFIQLHNYLSKYSFFKENFSSSSSFFAFKTFLLQFLNFNLNVIILCCVLLKFSVHSHEERTFAADLSTSIPVKNTETSCRMLSPKAKHLN